MKKRKFIWGLLLLLAIGVNTSALANKQSENDKVETRTNTSEGDEEDPVDPSMELNSAVSWLMTLIGF
ncbi:hypothetical protein [Labilibacter marinus]|uniref:hypothetical protein n=1 Tax=Labilibacter marinus TaxID=1477105 RepID=UPI00094F7C55|nr:hypothetical protein [Labilibacter marinus]